MARAHSGCEVWQQDFLALDLPDACFYGVFANASLFHVPSLALPEVLQQLHATLKPGGVLFSSNPRGQNQEGWNSGRRSEEHTSELQSLMRTSYAVFCLKKKNIMSPSQNILVTISTCSSLQ